MGDAEEEKKAETAEEKSDAAAGDADSEKLTCNKDECVYCGLCAKECPVDALKVDRKEKLWEVDEATCLKCGACVDKCPKKCLSIGAAAEETADSNDAPDSENPGEKASDAE